MARPLLPLLGALILGIVAAEHLALTILGAQIALLSFLLVLWISDRLNFTRFYILALHVAFALTGFLLLQYHLLPPAGGMPITSFLGPGKMTVEGSVAEPSKHARDRTALILNRVHVKEGERYIPLSGRLLLQTRGYLSLKKGDRVRFRSRFHVPRNFKNPGAFDYERFLHFQGIWARTFLPDPDRVVLLRRSTGGSLWERLESYRDRIRTTIARVAPESEGSIIQAMILGEQSRISPEVMESFNQTGTTHIIAISGFNVGIVALFSLFLLKRILRSSEWLLLRVDVTVIATSFALLVVCGYTYIAGAGLSVVRASLMVTATMIALLWGRERDLFNSLSLAALIILIIDPTSLFSISFQLSFSAVTALLLLVPPLLRHIGPHPVLPKIQISLRIWMGWCLRKMGHSIMAFIMVTLAATLGTLPFILYHFNRLSIVSLVANLVAVPLLGILATPVCLLIILVLLFSETMASWLIGVVSPLVHLSLTLIGKMASWSWSSLYVPTPSLAEITVYYLLLLSVGWWLASTGLPLGMTSDRMNHRSILVKIVVVLSLCFFLVDAGVHWKHSQHTKRLALTAIDVGQGSSILVCFPGGQRMLVDGGGSFDEHFDIGRSVLAPFLWNRGIARIDKVVLTHPHPDHLQGLLFIISHFAVQEVWTNGDAMDSPLYLNFRDLLRKRGIPERVLNEDAPPVEIGGVAVTILNPPAHHKCAFDNGGTSLPSRRDSEKINGMNERSLVLRLCFGKRAFLLTGDIGAATEGRITANHLDLQSDYLFVPHHGSQHSSTAPFLDRVCPRVGVVSCGTDNRFGFPHPKMIQRMEERQITLYSTDRDGAVTCATDGNVLEMRTFTGRATKADLLIQ